MIKTQIPFWQRLRSDEKYRQNLEIREKIIDATRLFFKDRGFRELSTPLLVTNPGTEPYLEVFETNRLMPDGRSERRFLTTSPELFIKKALVGGVGSCFEITRSFRNMEGDSPAHQNEFTILEWYRTPGDYELVMQDFEQWLLAIGRSIWGNSWDESIQFQSKKYQLSKPWPRLSIREAFEKYVAVNDEDLIDEKRLPEIAGLRGLSNSVDLSWEEAFHLLLLNLIEPHLGVNKPTILYDYPASQAALSKRKASDPRFAERFEVYLGGLELGNAFSELLDADEQEERMQADVELRQKLGRIDYDFDQDFIAALREGMPETGGIAVGLDRVVMLFADVADIRDVIIA